MKLVVSVSILLVLIWQEPPVAGFVPIQNQFARRQLLANLGAVDKAASDVSVPYDDAARLAYDQWRADFGKGDFDEKRFRIFKDNYEIVTVANVKAKKKARDEGTVSLSLMSLNEYGDMTQEEFYGGQQQQDDPPSIEAPPPPPQPTTTSDILGKAVEAVELQTEASNALEEAFDALAVEELMLAEALGLESVDELEEALDSLEGIDSDGGELDTSTLAREARIRDAYLNWCKEFDKEPDEARFPCFSQNFLFMEQYVKTTGKEMALNMYADFSKEEYEAAAKGASAKAVKVPTPPLKDPTPPQKDPTPPEKDPPVSVPETTVAAKAPSAPAPKATAPAAAKPATSAAPESGPFLSTDDVLGAAIGVTQTLGSVLGAATVFAKSTKENLVKSFDEGMKEIEASAETPEDRQKRLERSAAEQKAYEKAAAEARDERVKAIQERAKLEQERRQQIDKERSDRLKKSEMAAAKAQAETEAAAIASAKAEAARQNTMSAQRAYFEAQAAEQARQKAREFEEKLRTRQPPPPPPPTKKSSSTNIFANIFSKGQPETKKPPAPLKAPAMKIQLEATKMPVVKKAPILKPPVKMTPVASPAVSFFAGTPPKYVDPLPTPVVKAAPPKPTPVVKAVPPAKPSSPTLSLFAPAPKPKETPVKKETTATKILPVPVPRSNVDAGLAKKKAPVQKEDSAPAFSFFSFLPKKEAPKPIAKVQSSPTLSLLSTPSKPKAKESSPAPAPEKAPAFSFFGSPSKPQVPKIPNRGGTINILGNDTKPKKEPVIPNRGGTINILGNASKPKKEPVIPNRGGTINILGNNPKPKNEPVESSPSFSFFGKPAVSKSAPAPAPKSSGTIGVSVPASAPKSSGMMNIFGSGKSSTLQKPPAEKAPAQKKPAARVAPPKNLPILSRWKQNPDGSITGKVSNSPSFSPGTEITTSPVRKGAEAGSVVKTGSGSQYYLA